MLAWPTMLQNLISGLQPMVDHALVGHLVGYAGNAAMGVSVQIFIVVMAFIMSVFSGMGVLVSRFAGANDPELVNRTLYQAFLAAVVLWAVLLAPWGGSSHRPCSEPCTPPRTFRHRLWHSCASCSSAVSARSASSW